MERYKEYIIWLKSGSSLEGTAYEPHLLEMKEVWECYLRRETAKRLWILADSEGNLYVDLERIEAIAINEPKAEKVINPHT